MDEAATLFGDLDDVVGRIATLPQHINALDPYDDSKKYGDTNPDGAEGLDLPHKRTNLIDRPRAYKTFRLWGKLNPDYKSFESVIKKVFDVLTSGDKSWERSKNVKSGSGDYERRTATIEKPGLGSVVVELKRGSVKSYQKWDGNFYMVIYVQKDSQENPYQYDPIVIDRARAAAEGLTVQQVKDLRSYLSNYYSEYQDDPDRKVSIRK